MNGWRRWWEAWTSRAVVPLTPADRECYFRIAGVARTVAIAVLGGAFMWFVRDEPTWFLALTAVIVFPGTVVTWVMIRRSGVLAPHVWLRDLLCLAAFAAVVPEFFLVSLLTSLAVLVFCAITLRRTTTFALCVVAVVAMGLAAAAHATREDVLAASLFPLAIAAVVVPTQLSAHVLQRSIDFNTRIADALNVALFERTGVAGRPTTMHHLYAPSNRRFPNRISEDEWLDILHPDDLPVSDEIDAAVSAGQGYHVRYRQMIERLGEYRWIEEIGHVEVDGDGVRVQGMTRDITDAVIAEQQLQRLDLMADSIEVSISVLRLVDPDDPTSLTVVKENRAAQQVDGRDHSGMRVIDFNRHAFDTEHHRGLGYAMAEVAAGGPAFRIADAHLRLAGEERLFSIVCSPLPDLHCVVVMQDVTDLWQARAELERLAYVDALTGLPNRTRFREALAAAPVGSVLLSLDLDRFTDVNEAFGHTCGDEMIVEVGRVLAEAPDGVVVARLGEDEFALLVPPGTGTREELVARVFQALSLPVQLPNGLVLQASASMGITTKNRLDTPADELLRQADVALNHAKQFRNTYEFYDARTDSSAPHRMMLLGELRRALTSGELELHHQPAVSARTGEICSVESLLVWRHPSLGVLSARELTEMVSLSNLNADIVLQSLREAVRHHTRWREHGFTLPVSINVEGATLHDQGLVDRMTRVIAEAGLPRHTVGLEIAERQLRLGSPDCRESLRRLAEAGFWLTIDHYGSGKTPFSALRGALVNAVKLDSGTIGEFVPSDETLFDAMTTVMHRIGLTIAAGGADDDHSFRWLVDHGVDQVQGSVVGPLMDVDQMLVFLGSPRTVPVAR
jgi:diguanylate cyclase (GGDEF)-like protein